MTTTLVTALVLSASWLRGPAPQSYGHRRLAQPVVMQSVVDKPYPSGTYDPDAARSYFSTKPLEVTARAFELLFRSARFGASLLGDAVGGTLDERADERALELAKLLTTLGPTLCAPRNPAHRPQVDCDRL